MVETKMPMRKSLQTAALFVSLAATVVALVPATAGAAPMQVVRGAGFGHGIGMSQYGAYGMAQQGWGYAKILRHYYKGTKLGEAPSRPVRVLLQASDPYVRFSGASTGPGGIALSPRTTYVVRRTGGRLALYGAGGKRVGTYRAPLTVSRGGKPLRLLGPAIQGVTSGRYRGSLELHPGSLGGVTAVNALPIDDYVQGVVPGEVPALWHANVLRAQAVTARTYALSTRKTDGGIFDQYPDTRSQMYKGVTAETSSTNSAVRRTAGEIVTYKGRPATTYYFSTSGGRTENVENSWPGATPQPWLKSIDDPYDSISPKHRWTVRFSNARMGALLGSPGALKRVDVLQRGVSPRVVRARVYGSNGSVVLTGPQIRARLGLDDTWAYFSRVGSAKAAKALSSRWLKSR
jgi:stage II sporulation protein D